MAIQPIRTGNDVTAAIGASREQPVLLFKHSSRCGVSFRAKEEFDQFVASRPSVGLYQVLVVEDRPASNAITEETGVRHQSPQALLLVNGEVAWTASHGSITAKSLESAVSKVTT